VLLADPDGTEACYRAAEFQALSVESVETYCDQIRGSIRTLLDMQKRYPNLKFRLHNELSVFRIILTDKQCFVGTYTERWKGATSPTLMITSSGILFESFARFFERAWSRSRELSEAERHSKYSGENKS